MTIDSNDDLKYKSKYHDYKQKYHNLKKANQGRQAGGCGLSYEDQIPQLEQLSKNAARSIDSIQFGGVTTPTAAAAAPINKIMLGPYAREHFQYDTELEEYVNLIKDLYSFCHGKLTSEQTQDLIKNTFAKLGEAKMKEFKINNVFHLQPNPEFKWQEYRQNLCVYFTTIVIPKLEKERMLQLYLMVYLMNKKKGRKVNIQKYINFAKETGIIDNLAVPASLQISDPTLTATGVSHNLISNYPAMINSSQSIADFIFKSYIAKVGGYAKYWESEVASAKSLLP